MENAGQRTRGNPRKKTLNIGLHWAGEGNTNKEFNDCLAFPGLEALNAIIGSSEEKNQLWSTKNNIENVFSIIANAQKYWNVDPKEIAVTGYSNGGDGNRYFTQHHPKLFSEAIRIASASYQPKFVYYPRGPETSFSNCQQLRNGSSRQKRPIPILHW